jgi:hypothetical protein
VGDPNLEVGLRSLTVLILLLIPVLAIAGPNAGGVLLVHANTALIYTSDTTSYCGQAGLQACSLAVTSVPWDPATTTVFYVMAAFPDTSQPRLKALAWGVDWDDSKLVILAHGSCADFDIPDGGWPASGKGIGQSFLETRTGLLTELYWFAGYAYGAELDSTSVVVIPHPLQGGTMVDDAVPPAVDSLMAYGTLGFGAVVATPCPAGPDQVTWIPGDTSGWGVAEPSDSDPDPDQPADLASGNSPIFVETTAQSDSALVSIIRTLEREYKLSVGIAMFPNAFICRTSGSQLESLEHSPLVRLATADLIPDIPPLDPDGPPTGQLEDTRRVWNAFISAPPPDTATTLIIANDVKYTGDKSSDSRPTDDPLLQCSMYLIGDVFVSAVFVESSTWAGECPNNNDAEDWTATEVLAAKQEIIQALWWLTLQSPLTTTPRFWWGWYNATTSYEPITMNRDDVLTSWGPECLTAIDPAFGYYDDFLKDCGLMNNYRRAEYGLDWAVTLLLVDNSCDDDKMFADETMAATYRYGPAAMVPLFTAGMDEGDAPTYLSDVVKHEMLHFFGAADEYDESSDCDDCGYSTVFGYLRERNSNCSRCGGWRECVMDNGVSQAMCPYTMKHIGWSDYDHDGFLDPIDHPDADASMRMGPPQKTLELGAYIDITDNGQFVRRMPASMHALHNGTVVWDGINYDGREAGTGDYLWKCMWRSCGQGSQYYKTLADDVHFPTGSAWVSDSSDPADPFWMKEVHVQFTDEDTHGGIMRINVAPTNAGWDAWICDHVYRDDTTRPGNNEIVELFPYPWGTNGRATVVISDVGGGHTVTLESPQFSPPPADVRNHEIVAPEDVWGKVEVRGSPSKEGAVWELRATPGEVTDWRLFDAAGREVRRWSETADQSGVVRGGLSDGGEQGAGGVPSGVYLLRVTGGEGHRRVGRIVVLR